MAAGRHRGGALHAELVAGREGIWPVARLRHRQAAHQRHLGRLPPDRLWRGRPVEVPRHGRGSLVRVGRGQRPSPRRR